jgi:hypothetical protein
MVQTLVGENANKEITSDRCFQHILLLAITPTRAVLKKRIRCGQWHRLLLVKTPTRKLLRTGVFNIYSCWR